MIAWPALAGAQGTGAAGEGKPAIIERMPLTLRDPQLFQMPMHLEAIKKVNVAARKDGVVAVLSAEVGDTVQAQAEVARLDTEQEQLELTRAQAAFQAAQADQRAAGAAASASALVEVAKANLSLAQLQLERCTVRAPFAGRIIEVHVVEGEFVQAGQPLMTIIDSSQLQVEVPVDGKTINANSLIELKIEDQTATATVKAVIPLADRFEPLRDLFLSVASAVAVIDNSNGKYRAGQTVYSTMVPRQPVTEVVTTALSNATEGDRKVQVIRDGFVRDVRVQLLGQVGEDHVFVTGRFGLTDELVVKTSERLLDGARVVPQDAVAAQPKAATGANSKSSNF